MRMGVRVKDTMSKNPITCRRSDTIISCANLMKVKDVGSLLICNGDDVLGIVTEQDFTRKVVAENMDINKEISEIMETNVMSISPNKDIEEAITLMAENEIRHMPVIEDNKLVGFITMKDILKIQPDLIEIIINRYLNSKEEFVRNYNNHRNNFNKK